MKLFGKEPTLRLVHGQEAERRGTQRPAAETHLHIMVEQMVRDGRSAHEIETAVREAA